MKCPECGADSRVVISREYEHGFAVKRRRECLKCGYRFTTREYIKINGKEEILKNSERTS